MRDQNMTVTCHIFDGRTHVYCYYCERVHVHGLVHPYEKVGTELPATIAGAPPSSDRDGLTPRLGDTAGPTNPDEQHR